MAAVLNRTSINRRRIATLVLVVVASTGLLACSDSGKPSSSSSSGPSEVDRLLDEGVTALNSGQLDVAKQKYLEVIQKDSLNKIAYYDLGVIAQQQNDVAGARDNYGKAILIDSKYQPALFNLAILETEPNPARAEDLYRQLLAINANDANVHFNLGLLLKQVGRTQEGDAELATAVQIDPALASRIPADSGTPTEGTPESSASGN